MTVGESFMTVGSFLFLLQKVLRLCQTVQVLSPCVGIFQLSELNFLQQNCANLLTNSLEYYDKLPQKSVKYFPERSGELFQETLDDPTHETYDEPSYDELSHEAKDELLMKPLLNILVMLRECFWRSF